MPSARKAALLATVLGPLVLPGLPHTHRGHMPSEHLGLAALSNGIGVAWDEMRGLYPDDVYRFIPLGVFR
jgi:hypothetical protein